MSDPLSDLGLERRPEGEVFEAGAARFVWRGAVLRQEGLPPAETLDPTDLMIEDPAFHRLLRQSYLDKYAAGDPARVAGLAPDGAAVLDLGCGNGLSAELFFGDRLARLAYVGVDLAQTVEIAAASFARRGYGGTFIQADMFALPAAAPAFDLVFSPGVLHHTGRFADAVALAARLLRPAGRFLFHVSRTPPPVVGAIDRLMRAAIAPLPLAEAQAGVAGLVDIKRIMMEHDFAFVLDRDVPALGIRAGRYTLAQFMSRYFVKAFWNADVSRESCEWLTMDYVRDATVQTLEEDEVRQACAAAGLTTESLTKNDNTVAVVARRT